MKDDTDEHNPGRAEFWQSFYANDGRLQEKEWGNRRAKEIAENGSLRDHYEWFMTYPRYEAPLTACLTALARRAAASPPRTELRVLHIGCGNSDLCDHLPVTVSTCREELGHNGTPSGIGPVGGDIFVLNTDICGELLQHLAQRYPDRHYAEGNCCSMTVMPSEENTVFDDNEWYHCRAGQIAGEATFSKSAEPASWPPLCVRRGSVDVVCDKGTLDALMSAFAGDYNPNVEAYANEALKVLRPGGLLFIVSINAADVVNSYVLAAYDEHEGSKGFSLSYTTTIELPHDETSSLRVETLGSRYVCYGYEVVTE